MTTQPKLPSDETIRDYVTQALSEVDMLNSGQYQWRTSIPVQMSDSDVRISNALYCVSPLLEQVEALQAENERLSAENELLRTDASKRLLNNDNTALERIEELEAVLRDIRNGVEGNRGNCEDCDTVARVATATLESK